MLEVKNVNEGLLDKDIYLLVADIATADDSGCGDTCDEEFELGLLVCDVMDYVPDNIEGYIACMASYYDDDCYDCLCDVVLADTGYSCP